jgi:hypothetical protein
MRWLFGAVALMAVLCPRLSFAEPAPDAGDAAVHVDHGVSLYKKGDFKGALAEFETAHRLSGSWKVLVHVGMAEARLARYQDALRTLERYLALGGAEVPEASRAIVKREIEGIRAVLAEVTIIVEGGDAELTVDGQSIGRAPLKAPILLGPGEHTIVARRSGFEPGREEVKLTAGMRRTVQLALVPERGILRVETRPIGARVLVDGREVGRAPWEERVLLGRHTVLARLRGYLEGRSSVLLEGGRAPTLILELAAEPPPPRKPWYRRWYVWTVIGGAVVAGVVTAAVVVTWPRYDVVLK